MSDEWAPIAGAPIDDHIGVENDRLFRVVGIVAFPAWE